MLVKGMTPELYEKIIPYVTVYGSGKINANTAPEPVLAALGLSPGVRRDIISYRAGRDSKPGTADDGIFDSSLTIVQKLEQSNALTQDEVTELLNASAVQLGTAATAFTVTSRAYVPGGKIPGAEVRAVIDSEGSILYWRER
jgi:type II secretory pathway component PulK